MSFIFKSIAIITIFSMISGSYGQNYNMFEIFTLAEKLNGLFKAISSNKLTFEEQTELYKFRLAVKNSWDNIINSIKNVESSKVIDAYIALLNNQGELLSQLLNIFNLDQLLKWSQMVSEIIKNIDNNKINCNETLCELTTTPSIWNDTNTTQYFNTTWYSTLYTSLPQNITMYTNELLNLTTLFPFTTETPVLTTINDQINTTETTQLENTQLVPQNLTTTTLQATTINNNPSPTSTTYPHTSVIFNTTTTSTTPTTTTTTTLYQSTTVPNTSNPSNLTSQTNSITTVSVNNTTILYTSTSEEPTNIRNTTTSINTNNLLSQNHVFIDSEFCKYYSNADCLNRIEISLLCPAMCRCSTYNCQNNGTLAINEEDKCKCVCKQNFTGPLCETILCTEKEYCSYFNDSYCTVTMIEENCPKLCGKC